MKKFLLVMFVGVILSGLMGCGKSPALQSEKDRITSPDVNKTDLEALAYGNNTFAFDLYQALKENTGNL